MQNKGCMAEIMAGSMDNYRIYQREWKRKWRQKPENREKERQATQKWRSRPGNEHKNLEWYYKNKEHAKKKRSEYLHEPKMAFYLSIQRRRGGKLNKFKIALYHSQKGRCNYCERELALPDLHVDHRIPLKHNGSNDISNLQLLCNSCNIVKKDKIETPELIDWCKRLTLEACKMDVALPRPRYTKTGVN